MYDQYAPVIGLICVGVSAPIEHYFHLNVPEGVNVTSTHVPLTDISREGMQEMISRLPEAVRLLSEAKPSVLVILNFTASCLMGQEMINVLQQTAGVPVIVPGKAYVDFLRRRGLTRLGLVSTFGVELNMAERIFFEQNGIRVTSIKSVWSRSALLPDEIGHVDRSVIDDYIRQTAKEDVDAILVDYPLFFPKDRRESGLAQKPPLLFMAEILLQATLSALHVIE